MKFLNRIIPKSATETALISMHIPKTAGTSFAKILKEVYGHENVSSLHVQNINDNVPRITYNDQPYNKQVFSNQTKVLHGHFHYAHLQDVIHPSPTTPVITWLRHPVARVVSAYRYVDKIFREEVSDTDPRFNILKTVKRNMMEYAHSQQNRNLIAQFMQGSQLSDFHFIGILEHFEEDLAYLASLLGWQNYTVPHLNRTSSTRPPLAEFKQDAIRLWNQEDMEIYEEVLALRKERKSIS
jgi:hypothetical protein